LAQEGGSALCGSSTASWLATSLIETNVFLLVLILALGYLAGEKHSKGFPPAAGVFPVTLIQAAPGGLCRASASPPNRIREPAAGTAQEFMDWREGL